MPLFEVAVILETKKEDGKVVAEEELVIEPKWMMAKSSDAAAYKAVRDVPEGTDFDRMKVLVRPFA